jgi:hypothetical protein
MGNLIKSFAETGDVASTQVANIYQESKEIFLDNFINPYTKAFLSNDEVEAFIKLDFLKSKFDNPYDYLKKLFEKLTKVRLPELPASANLKGDWSKMLTTWFFETQDVFDSNVWNTSKLCTFSKESLICQDIIESVSFSDTKNTNSVKGGFFSKTDSNRANPYTHLFKFTGPETGIKDYYSTVEWFIGSYNANVYWQKQTNGTYKIKTKIQNTSSWYSATRLPKSWQNRLRETLGIEMKSIFTNGERGTTIRNTLNEKIVIALDYLGIDIPSFGGNWDQIYEIETTW